MPAAGQRKDVRQLVPNPLSRNGGQARGITAHEVVCGIVDPKTELGRLANRSQQPKRVVQKRICRDGPYHAPGEICPTAMEIDDARREPFVNRHSHCIDREIALTEIDGKLSGAQPSHIDCEILASRTAHNGACHIPTFVQHEEMAGKGIGHFPGKGNRSAGNDKIDVTRFSLKKPVSNVAADQPRFPRMLADEIDNLLDLRILAVRRLRAADRMGTRISLWPGVLLSRLRFRCTADGHRAFLLGKLPRYARTATISAISPG
jgi:hypothetical protein